MSLLALVNQKKGSFVKKAVLYEFVSLGELKKGSFVKKKTQFFWENLLDPKKDKQHQIIFMFRLALQYNGCYKCYLAHLEYFLKINT